MLKAEATGPRVPAIIGKADEANHQRLKVLDELWVALHKNLRGTEVNIIVGEFLFSLHTRLDKFGLGLDDFSQSAVVHGGDDDGRRERYGNPSSVANGEGELRCIQRTRVLAGLSVVLINGEENEPTCFLGSGKLHDGSLFSFPASQSNGAGGWWTVVECAPGQHAPEA